MGINFREISESKGERLSNLLNVVKVCVTVMSPANPKSVKDDWTLVGPNEMANKSLPDWQIIQFSSLSH